jgi:hypothetical protein
MILSRAPSLPGKAVIVSAQSNPVGIAFLLAFVGLCAAAVATAKGLWKFLNIGIVLAFMLTGVGLGAAAGMMWQDVEIGGSIAPSFAFVLGVVGAWACWRQNGRRAKALKESGEQS